MIFGEKIGIFLINICYDGVTMEEYEPEWAAYKKIAQEKER